MAVNRIQIGNVGRAQNLTFEPGLNITVPVGRTTMIIHKVFSKSH